MADQTKIIAEIDAGKTKVAIKTFQDAQVAVKALDYAFRKQEISAIELSKGLNTVNSAVLRLNASKKQSVDIDAQIFQVNARAAVGFNSLGKSLHELTQASNRSQQGFIALAYIIQDLPYGIRGVANNITQLSQILGTPIWANIAISALTSIAVIMSNIKTNTAEASEAVSDFWSKFTVQDLDITKLKQLQNAIEANIKQRSQIIKDIPSKIGATTEGMGTEWTKIQTGAGGYTKEFAESEKKRLEQLNSIDNELLQYTIKKIKTAEELDRLMKQYGFYVQEKPKKEKGIEYNYYGDISDVEFLAGKDTTALDERNRQLYSQQLAYREAIAEHLGSKLQEKAKMYDTVFFDPLRNGFNDLNSIIRTDLFGSLEEMKNRFGVVGASIIQALNSVIAKLTETAIMAAIVSLATGGGATGLSFLGAFKELLKGNSAGTLIFGDTGGWISEPVIGRGMKTGRTYSLAENNPEYLVNPRRVNNSLMAGMGGGIQTVRVVGKLSGRDILIASETEKAYSSSRW